MQRTKSPLFNRPAGGGTIFSVAGANMTTGTIWFVDSGAGAASDAITHGSSPEIPFATVDYAISQCTADKGDIIYVMPGHVEATTTDTELFDLDKAAVSIIGLGEGALRPKFTITHVDANCVVGASGCRVSNCQFISNIADIVEGFIIEAAAVGSEFDHNYLNASTAGKEFLIGISVEANADRLLIHDNHMIQLTGDESTDAIHFEGGSDGTIIRDNHIQGDFKTNAAVSFAAAASENIIVLNNTIINIEATTSLSIGCHGSSTGVIAGNFCGTNQNDTRVIDTVTLMHLSENYGNDAPNTTGILDPDAGA